MVCLFVIGAKTDVLAFDGIVNRSEEYGLSVEKISKDKPILLEGNSSFHDTMGKRDVTAFYDQKSDTYFMYYSCIESLYNVSFENIEGMGVNGWKAINAETMVNGDQKMFEQSSLKILHKAADISGVYTGDYVWKYNNKEYSYPAGYAVIPAKDYVVSVWFKADTGKTMTVHVQQYNGSPSEYSTYHLVNGDYKPEMVANGQWQRMVVPFKTLDEAKEITISLLMKNSRGGEISYWDGVQLEIGKSASDFPSSYRSFPLLRTVGWRMCIATSNDGFIWQEKGLIELSDPLDTEWDSYYKWEEARNLPYYNYHPGINEPANGGITDSVVYEYNGKYYMNYLVGDAYAGGVFDEERFRVPYPPYLSGLAVAGSPAGPFVRIYDHFGSEYDDFPIIKLGKEESWNELYTIVSGAPFKIGDDWYSYYCGYSRNGVSGYNGIFSSVAISVSKTPLGPWQYINTNDPMYFSNYYKIVENTALTKDPKTDNYFVFSDVERKSDGYSSGTVYITKDPLLSFDWNPEINNNHFEYLSLGEAGSWDSQGIDVIFPLVSASDPDKIFTYYMGRGERTNNSRSGGVHLYHNIGMAVITLKRNDSCAPISSATINELITWYGVYRSGSM